MFSKSEYKQIVNKLGSSYKSPFESYVFVRLAGTTINNGMLVEIYNKKRNESLIRPISKLKEGRNPFNSKRNLPKDWVIGEVNKIGRSYKNPMESFSYSNLAGRDSQGKMLVKVFNKQTNSYSICRFTEIRAGKNPFNRTQDRHEEKVVHPIVLRALKKMGFVSIEKEVSISSRSRLDFLCTNKKGQKIVIEVKSDKRKHSSKMIKTQLKKYTTDAKRKYGRKFSQVFLVSPKGLHGGYALCDLKSVLKQKGLI